MDFELTSQLTTMAPVARNIKAQKSLDFSRHSNPRTMRILQLAKERMEAAWVPSNKKMLDSDVSDCETLSTVTSPDISPFSSDDEEVEETLMPPSLYQVSEGISDATYEVFHEFQPLPEASAEPLPACPSPEVPPQYLPDMTLTYPPDCLGPDIPPISPPGRPFPAETNRPSQSVTPTVYGRKRKSPRISQKSKSASKRKRKPTKKDKKMGTHCDKEFLYPVDVPEASATYDEYFYRYFSKEMIHIIVEMSNLYGVQFMLKSVKTNEEEIKKFLAIELLMGVVKMNSYLDYWSNSLRYDKIAMIMPLKRYENLRRHIHFADHNLQEDDPFFKVRPLLEENCHNTLNEVRQSIDEMMVPYKGKKAGKKKQYINPFGTSGSKTTHFYFAEFAMDGCQPSSFQSICHVRASELFPKQLTTREDAAIQTPFTLLCGEAVEALGRTADGVLALSNYRFFVDLDDNGFHNIPLGAIESVELRDLVFLYVFCKDGRSLRCSFQTNERCQDWLKRLTRATSAPKQIEDHFAFAFHAWAFEEEGEEILSRLSSKQKVATFMDEVGRLKFNLNGPWRISDVNAEYNLCPSYPPRLLVPAAVSDAALEAIAKFRVACRLPVVVWRHPTNGAVIARSSQPEVGLLCWRSQEDEEFICAVRAACALDSPNPDKENDPLRKVLIMDARSFSTAFVNRARGGGVECHEYYQHCDIEFMNLPNIHTIRKSFQALRLLCGTADNPNWWQVLDSTKWLNHIAGLLSAAVIAADAVDKHARPVLVHCSDGWDRTPQIVSLAQILLDPYYRTVEGFRALVQREWLDFGHKFGDRCGNSVANDDVNDRCPVFLQWLDSIHQLLIQFPCSFQYSELYLVKLVQHTYSNLFGTFLANSPRERAHMKIAERTFSVWPLLQDPKYLNLLYIDNPKVLRPSFDVRDMAPWYQVFQGLPAQPASPSAPSHSPRISDNDRYCSPLRPPLKDSFPMPKLVAARRNGRKAALAPVIGENETESSNGQDVIDGPLSLTSNTPDEISSVHSLHKNGDATFPAQSREYDPIDETETRQEVLSSATRGIRLRPVRKNRTISEELYERYVGPLDRSSICDSIENLNDLTLSQDSSNSSGTLILPLADHPVTDGGVGTTNGHGGHAKNGTDHCDDTLPRFDIDGLETAMNSVQIRVRRIMSDHRVRISALERELQAARLALVQQRCQNVTEQCSRPVSLCESDQNPSSLPSVQSLPSDLSWEAVEERELRTTLWVPDHAVSTCTGCNSQFWIGRRKHHCRKCGNIFCSDCSDHTAILPGEDLYYPVRVCNSCHSQVDTCVCCRSQSENQTSQSTQAPEYIQFVYGLEEIDRHPSESSQIENSTNEENPDAAVSCTSQPNDVTGVAAFYVPVKNDQLHPNDGLNENNHADGLLDLT